VWGEITVSAVFALSCKTFPSKHQSAEANHPLAGKDLAFDLRLAEVVCSIRRTSLDTDSSKAPRLKKAGEGGVIREKNGGEILISVSAERTVDSCFFHEQFLFHEILLVEHGDGFLGFPASGHFDKGKPSHLTGLMVA
jgi:hypothetical protein